MRILHPAGSRPPSAAVQIFFKGRCGAGICSAACVGATVIAGPEPELSFKFRTENGQSSNASGFDYGVRVSEQTIPFDACSPLLRVVLIQCLKSMSINLVREENAYKCLANTSVSHFIKEIVRER